MHGPNEQGARDGTIPDVVGLPLEKAYLLLDGMRVRLVATRPPAHWFDRLPEDAKGGLRVLRQELTRDGDIVLTVATEILPGRRGGEGGGFAVDGRGE